MATPRSSQGPSSSPTREALHLSEESFRLLVDGVKEYAIFMLDPLGVIVSWNSGAERIKQYSADQIIGRHFSVFYSADDIAAGKPPRELEIALRDGSVEDLGWRIRRDGTRFWANVVITALRDTDGKHIGFAKVTRDLTAKRQQEEEARRFAHLQLLESESRFARFTEHLPGLAWIKDLEGRYTYLNDAAAAAFGRTREEILGHTDVELFSAETAAQFEANDRRALDGATGIEVVEKLRNPGGEVRHSIVSKFPIGDGEGRLHMLGGIAFDITDRVTAEAALRDADRRKNEFLATLAHELRNPLAPIRNGVHLLREEQGAVPRERLHRMLEEQVSHMVSLVDDLLEISRISSGKVALKLAVADLHDIIRSAVDASASLIEAKRHVLRVQPHSEPVLVTADPVRLVQVVANLLNNAAKYTPDGGHITLSIAGDTDSALISVRDDGLGIPEEMLPRVFDMFAQIDHTLQRAQGGLGIGLALARSLVELHHGRLEARSEGLNRGAEFIVHLARATASLPDDRAPQSVAAERAALRVLVVDDSRDGADTLAMVLRQLGVDARVSYDGTSAIHAMREWQPSVVLMDIGMPGKDGYQVAREIRAEPELAAVRLIALTGWGSREDRQRSHDAGFDDHWVKPVDPTKLRELLAGSERYTVDER